MNRVVRGGCALGLATALGACGGGQGSSPEDVGTATLSVTNAPPDGTCVQVTAQGAQTVTRAFDVPAGQSTTFTLRGLPVGTVVFSGAAFGGTCASVTASTVPNWVSDPVTASVVVSPPVSLRFQMRRNGQASIGFDFPDGGADADDGGADAEGGLPADQSQWLDPMNAERAAVGEAPLKWDPIAAAVAQAWASQCNFSHNANASANYDQTGGTGSLGENIAAATPTQTAANAVAMWVTEKQYYTHATNSCASGQTCLHYTQVVWSTTTAVGCARVTCTQNSPFGGTAPWDFNVCNFSPAGNILGQSPY